MSKIYLYLGAICLALGGVAGWKLRGPSTPTPTSEVDKREERVVEKIVTIEKRPDGTEIRREEQRDRSSSQSRVVPVPKRKQAIEAGPRWSYQDLIRGRGKPEVWEAGYYRRVGDGNWWVGVRAASDKSVSIAVRVEI